jgi:serine phosphatase RsbU (regulator of sigma subunit)
MPFSDVGGDIADLFRLPNDFVAIYFGDVVGKDIAAVARFTRFTLGYGLSN